MKTTTLPSKHSMNLSPVRLALLLIPLVLACFALSPQVRATCQEGCSSNANTFFGEDALSNNIGENNTGFGFDALFNNTTGAANTAVGDSTLFTNTTGYDNTAIGKLAMFFNTDGAFNAASGDYALYSNTGGSFNTADGTGALFANTTGAYNTAVGQGALGSNTTSMSNTAVGSEALFANTNGAENTGIGVDALDSNTTGSANVALGAEAGSRLTTGNYNIDIANRGVAGEAGVIRIGTKGTHRNTFIAGINGATVPTGVAVIVDAYGHLGTTTSSEHFKDEIKPMDKASEAILSLKPVTFRYKHELDPECIPQFGLVAEDVDKVNPDLVARDEAGKPYTVRYEAVNAMLLNEFLKEHKTVQEQGATIARQQKQIEALTAGLQKVSAQLELSKTAPQVVNNF